MTEHTCSRASRGSRGLPAIGAAFAMLAPLAACAQTGLIGQDQRTAFALQAFAPQVSASLQVGDASGLASGSDVQLEDDLGLRRRGLAAGFVFDKRIGERWRFGLDVLSLRQEADTTLQRTLQLGTATFNAGAAVHSQLRLTLLGIRGGYALLQSGDAEFGITFGGLLSNARVDMQDLSSPYGTGWNSGAAMPLFGLHFSVALAPSLWLSGRAEGAGGNVDSYGMAALGVLWRPAPLVSVGAGWRLVQGSNHDHGDALFFAEPKRLDYRLGGPQAYAMIGF